MAERDSCNMNIESSNCMLERALEAKLRRAVSEYPVVTLTGPRQSGKTTLVRTAFPEWAYASLEAPDDRAFAIEDPRGFLGQFRGPAILDEVQRVPDLFSYIQSEVDRRSTPGQYLLSGSQNFLLMQGVSQSLAGRAAILHLLPLALSELTHRPPLSLDAFGKPLSSSQAPEVALNDVLFAGGYPRIHDRGLSPRDWLGNYYQTYLERDVRTLLAVGDLETFGRFVRLCAGRTAQLLDISALASDCGISHSTARRWLSVLESSFVISILRPFHRNFGKRLIKSPKLHFIDTGLLCFLLNVRDPSDLDYHPLKGPIFETFVHSELLKNFVNRGEIPALSFWRDSTGHEVDCILEGAAGPVAIEAKAGKTVAGDAYANLEYWRKLQGDLNSPAVLVYGGDRSFVRSGIPSYPWYAL